MEYTVIAPAYNEWGKIGGVVREFKAAGAKNIIVVDDGSSDGTGGEARLAGAEVVAHRGNLGKGAAIKSGIGKAKTEWIVLVDGDGQHSAGDLGKFLGKMAGGKFEFVNGSRFMGMNDMPLPRRIANCIVRRIFSFGGGGITDPLSGMRAFRKSRIAVSEEGFLVDLEIAFNAIESRMRVCEVPIEVRYFKGRKSKLTRFGHAFLEYAKIVLYCAKRAFLG